RYRHAIEALARGSEHSELDIARRAIGAAKDAATAALQREGGIRPGEAIESRRTQDPGYYLISKGRHAFERGLGFHVPLRDQLGRAMRPGGVVGYAAAIAAIAGVLLILPLLSVASFDVEPLPLCVLALLALLPASD